MRNKYSTSIFSFVRSLYLNQELIWQLTKRNIIGKYKGSILGFLWSFLNPLVMLCIYTFAFSLVFKSKWGLQNESTGDFALILFASLTIFNLFGDVLRESPTIVSNQPNFVKKVVFPLEVLPVVSLITAFIHSLFSLTVFFVFFAFTHSEISLSMLYLPFIFVPLLFISLGTSYFFSAVGVYLKDIGYIMGHIVTILLFTSPVFFSLERIPENFRAFIFLNPIAYILESARNVMVFGKSPDFLILGIYTLLGIFVFWFGYFWFQRTRIGFADVL
jgi:lipopolysaccharide transport system permease protein